MTDIFTDEELEAAADTLPQTDDAVPAETVQRDEQGRFAPKEDAPADEAEPPAEDKPKREGTVPQGALHAEREKRKGIEAELTSAREQLNAIAEMRRQIAERQPAALPAADDPAAIEHLRQRIEQQDQTLNRFTQQRDNDAVNNAEIMQLRDVMAISEAEFRTTQPDYDAAINHVVQARAYELSLHGLPQAKIHQIISEEAADIAREAVRQGRNPAELGYQIAMSRGYRAEQAAPAQNNAAVAQVEAIGRGQAAARSVGTSGGIRTQTLNAEAIASMSPEEFDALYSTPEGRKLIDNL